MNALFRLVAAALTLFTAPVFAIGLADLSNKDTVAAMKEALTKGSQAAVEMLGKQNGFLGNDRVRIPLPESLHQVEGLMIAEEEKKIRKDPVGSASSIIRKVFGAIGK